MKKVLNVLIISMLILSLTGCGSKKEEKNSNKQNVTGEVIATKVNVGDYVDYKAKKGTFKYDNQSVEITGEEKWQVIAINEDGSIELTKESSLKAQDELYFGGGSGYFHYEEQLNKIAQMYGSGKNVKSARNITYEDLIKYSGVDKYAEKYHIDLTGATTTQEKLDKIIEEEINNSTDYEKEVTVTSEYAHYEIADNKDGYVESDNYKIKQGLSYYFDLTENYDEKMLEILYGTTSDKFSYADFFIANKNSKIEEDLYDGLYGTYGIYVVIQERLEKTISAERRICFSSFYRTTDGYHAYPKPIITLDENTKVTGGNGTYEKPYTIV